VSKRLTDGNVKATWVTTIASITAPTVAELTAGTVKALEQIITDDGLDISFDEGTVSGNALNSTQDFEGPGRSKAGITLTCYRDSVTGDDVAWVNLVRGAIGYLVVRRGITSSTAYASTQKVEVYNVTVGERRPLAPERESYDKFEVTLYPSGTYSVESTVAA
jgi:hypothetical protein